VGQTQTPSESRALLRALGVVVVPDGSGGFVHNGAIHLLDGQGSLRALFDYTRWPEALAAARRVAEEAP
jgi:protein SCO1